MHGKITLSTEKSQPRPGVRRKSVGRSVTILETSHHIRFAGQGGKLLVTPERIADAIELLVGMLDTAQPCAECEESGIEDSFMEHPADGPGCSVADQDAGAWVEWTSLRAVGKRRANSTFGEEDAEDDDGGGDDDRSEDTPGFDRASRALANIFGEGAGCSISDSDYGGEEAGEQEDGI